MAIKKKVETRGGARPGSGPKPLGSAVMVVKSHRMTPEDWETFDAWGGVSRLRKTMDMFRRAKKGQA